MSEDVAGPDRSCIVEVTLEATPEAIYRTWTERFDTWFASPDAITMDPRVGQPYWFEVVHEGARHPHYGRFLALEPGELIKQTWVSGPNGTDGAETVVTVMLRPEGAGTHVVLTHSGFLSESAAQGHGNSWSAILRHLDDAITSGP
ncbi:MAG TPA: SRPBCC domain-containing protein [Acidimicrobiales bacterium]|jgi:uncharacterized protein YndB with AHSA1/START domain|nr:SRPBCC domain-containing protein [Acidimicrobiales bacterium]